MRSPKIGVQLFGKQFLRFIIANDLQEYYTGNDWSSNRRDALLYFHLELVRSDLRKLKRLQRKPN